MRKRLFFLALLLVSGWLIFNWNSPVLGIKVPPSIKVGLSTSEMVCDLQVVSGGYHLYVGNEASPLASLQVNTLWRAAFVPEQSMIQLFAFTQGGSWETVGIYNKISLVPLDSNMANRFSYGGTTYRGALSVTLNQTATAMTVVNELPWEQYLYGVVPREMSNQWPLESLKAQAVAARTYSVKNVNKHGAEGFDICNKSHCQVYGGYSCEGDSSRQAVDSTRGQVLVDENNSLIYALYHSNSGGHTEDNINVNGYPFSYLKGKPDPFSLGKGLSDWSYQTSMVPDGSGSSVFEKLKEKYPDLGPIAGISTASYDSGRVYQVTITDENGKQLQLGGQEFGRLFNPGFNTSVNSQSFMSIMFQAQTDARINVINGDGQLTTWDGGMKNKVVRNTGTIMPFSTGGGTYMARSAFGVKPYPKSPQVVTFSGHGWGHGVGMSQWGAYNMATQGYQYQDILKFYYEGARLISLE